MADSLSPAQLAAWAPGRLFRDAQGGITSLDLHRTEELLVTASEDDSVRLYDTAGGALLKTVHAKTYGVSRIACTHAPLCVLTAASARRGGHEHHVCYHSLHDNAYLRLFVGHTAAVLALAQHPKSDAFLTSSADGSVRFWDVRTNVCSGRLATGSAPVAAWDAQGLVFGVVTQPGCLKLFDAREYMAGPFDVVAFGDGAATPPATSLSFSLDGKQLLVAAGGLLHVLDSYNGQRLHCFSPAAALAAAAAAAAAAGAPPPAAAPSGLWAPEPCFSPDGRMVFCGCSDGVVRGWSTEAENVAGDAAAAWYGHAGVAGVVKFSQRRLLAASGCASGGLALWLPPPPPPQQQGAPAPR